MRSAKTRQSWCIAGKARRRLVDYGYWYQPPPRGAEKCAAFVAAEARPQALEWIFADHAGLPFDVSADDLTMAPSDRHHLRKAVTAARCDWLASDLPARAAAFCRALSLASGRQARKKVRRDG